MFEKSTYYEKLYRAYFWTCIYTINAKILFVGFFVEVEASTYQTFLPYKRYVMPFKIKVFTASFKKINFWWFVLPYTDIYQEYLSYDSISIIIIWDLY